MKRSWLFVCMTLSLLLAGCGAGASGELVILQQQYGVDDVTQTYANPQKGDEVLNKWSSVITVKSVSEDKIVLVIDGCLVEPNEDKTINMNAEPLKKITVKSGETVELAVQAYDLGARLFVTYE